MTEYELEQALHFAVGIRIVRQKVPAIFWKEWHGSVRKKYTNEPKMRGVLPVADSSAQVDNNLLRRGFLAQVCTSSAESEFAFTFSRLMAEGWHFQMQARENRDIWFQTVLVMNAVDKFDNRFLTKMIQPDIKEYRRLDSDEINGLPY